MYYSQTCTSDADTTDLTCTGSPTGWEVFTYSDKIAVTIVHKLGDTGVYRCEVTVDDEATDSKLVYAEAIGGY